MLRRISNSGDLAAVLSVTSDIARPFYKAPLEFGEHQWNENR